MSVGVVKWFNEDRGYGFISPASGGDDVYAHYSVIVMDGFRTLREGQKVEFEAQPGPKGLEADHVRPLKQ